MLRANTLDGIGPSVQATPRPFTLPGRLPSPDAAWGCRI